MPGPAHHRMQRVAQGALERVSGQAAVHLHVTYGRLDRTAPVDHRPEGARDASLLSGAQDAHPLDLHASVALVHDGGGGLLVSEDAHLLERFGQRMSVVGIARHAPHTHH